ncbi:MAG: hypothetical protein SV201_02390 [Pseudomonadota bacterium]|nr:hypothetical protein [Pseudomonadota bacterium]
MPIKKTIGVILLAHAVYVAFKIINNLDSLRQTSEAYAAPGDPFWIFWGFLGLNCLIVLATVILGVYFLRTKLLELRYTLPLSLVTALFGGYSLIVGALAISASIFQRFKPNAI